MNVVVLLLSIDSKFKTKSRFCASQVQSKKITINIYSIFSAATSGGAGVHRIPKRALFSYLGALFRHKYVRLQFAINFENCNF